MKKFLRWLIFVPLVLFFAFIPLIIGLLIMPPGAIFNVDNSWDNFTNTAWILIGLVNFLAIYSSIILWHWAGMRFLPINNQEIRIIILFLLSLSSSIPGFIIFSSLPWSLDALSFLLIPFLAIITVWFPRFRRQILR
jgi:hypothetical protein